MSDCWCGGVTVEDIVNGNEIVNVSCTASDQHDPLDVAPKPPYRRLYVSGPMSGYPDCNYPEFRRVAALLAGEGYDVVDPSVVGNGRSYREILKEDIRALLDCDGVAVLPGWLNSKGAKAEVGLAQTLQMPVYGYEHWLSSHMTSQNITDPQG